MFIWRLLVAGVAISSTTFYVAVARDCMPSGVQANEFFSVLLGSFGALMALSFVWKMMGLKEIDLGRLSDRYNDIYLGAIAVFLGSGYVFIDMISLTVKALIAC